MKKAAPPKSANGDLRSFTWLFDQSLRPEEDMRKLFLVDVHIVKLFLSSSV